MAGGVDNGTAVSMLAIWPLCPVPVSVPGHRVLETRWAEREGKKPLVGPGLPPNPGQMAMSRSIRALHFIDDGASSVGPGNLGSRHSFHTEP